MPQRHRPELSESVAGEKLTGYRRLPRTFGSNRVCSAAGCGTRLSMYNAESLCSTHAAHHVAASASARAATATRPTALGMSPAAAGMGQARSTRARPERRGADAGDGRRRAVA